MNSPTQRHFIHQRGTVLLELAVRRTFCAILHMHTKLFCYPPPPLFFFFLVLFKRAKLTMDISSQLRASRKFGLTTLLLWMGLRLQTISCIDFMDAVVIIAWNVSTIVSTLNLLDLGIQLPFHSSPLSRILRTMNFRRTFADNSCILLPQ